MSELFDMEESLSPELQYIENATEIGVDIYSAADQDGHDGEFIAAFEGVEFEGETEIEAASGLLEELGRDSFDEWRMKGGGK